MSILRSGYLLLAQKLQEASDSLTSSDVRARLSDAIQDASRGTGKWSSYIDHTGDGTTGDVIYSCDGDVFQAKYEISGGTGTAAKCVIDMAGAIDVVPRTIYEPEADEADHYAAMESAKLYLPGDKDRYLERMIPKSERDKAGSGSFAGKGKSFPILKAEDVAAAASSLGRAGAGNYSTDVIKRNIIRIAKDKGWTAQLPKAWQDGGGETKEAKKQMKDCPGCDGTGKGDDAKDCPDCNGTGQVPLAADTADEAARTRRAGSVMLVESAAFPATFEFREATATNPLVKIISPGRGSSGYYAKEVIQRDGPKIFKRGTLMYINHATPAEEAQRPEGDWSKLAAVTTGDAYWDDNGKDGAALYAPAKVFSGHAAEVAEKAPHTGVSIRASGQRDDKAIAPDGKPGVITSLTHAESIDLVTKAGRDGKLLLESAEGGDMADTELKKLQEAQRSINIRLAEAPARRLAEASLANIKLAPDSKMAIVERALTHVAVKDDGTFDEAAFKPILEAELKYAASFLPAGAKVEGLGAPVVTDPAILESRRVEESKRMEFSLNRSAGLLNIESETGKRVFREGRAAFDPTYNSRKKVVT